MGVLTSRTTASWPYLTVPVGFLTSALPIYPLYVGSKPQRVLHGSLRTLQVSDMAFMGMKGGKLVNLDVSGLALTDVGLSWLADASPRLENIVFHGCEKLSILGLTALAERCTALRKLDFDNNRGLTSEWLQAMAVGFQRGGKSLRWVRSAIRGAE